MASSAQVRVLLALLAAGFLVAGGLYLYATRRGKFEVWREVLSELPPPESALDMGCGRGAVAILIATTFSGCRVEAVDLWRSIDQSGNGPDAATANARANHVDDRITFESADMTQLPYEDAAFDLVTASLSIHNIRSAAGRDRAIDQAWRVLAPGGQLRIVDISKVAQYEERLRSLGASDIRSRDAGWRLWWSGPWMRTRVLTASRQTTPRES